ncbi:MAG: hypothetical protein KBA30_06665, partial [Clostridia bacterium]|nr:hypothetical protein [Clostridia bacterium]
SSYHWLFPKQIGGTQYYVNAQCPAAIQNVPDILPQHLKRRHPHGCPVIRTMHPFSALCTLNQRKAVKRIAVGHPLSD